MEPLGSTLRGHGTVEFYPLAPRRAGGGHTRPGELAALLLPLVRRSIRTGRGPVALVLWLRQRGVAPRTGTQLEHTARRLTEDLIRTLREPPDPPDDTPDN